MMRIVGKFVLSGILGLSTLSASALTVEELEQGITEALDSQTSGSPLAIYVNGYITGSVNFAQSIGLVCVDGKLTTSLDLMRQIRNYLQANPSERNDGAQLIINRAMIHGHKC